MRVHYVDLRDEGASIQDSFSLDDCVPEEYGSNEMYFVLYATKNISGESELHSVLLCSTYCRLDGNTAYVQYYTDVYGVTYTRYTRYGELDNWSDWSRSNPDYRERIFELNQQIAAETTNRQNADNEIKALINNNAGITAELSAPFSEHENSCDSTTGDWYLGVDIPQIGVSCGAFGNITLPSCTFSFYGIYGGDNYCFIQFTKNDTGWKASDLYKANCGDTDGYIEVSGNELKSINIYVGHVDVSGMPALGGTYYQANRTLNAETTLTLNQITSADEINTEISEKIASLESRIAALEAPSGSGIVYAKND